MIDGPRRKRLWAGVGLVLAAAALGTALRWRGGSAGDGPPSYRLKGGGALLIAEFSDFQCPNCAEAEPVLKDLLARYEGRVRLAFRHHPLKGHTWARLAAQAAESAGLQGRFWEYHGRLFQSQKEWSTAADPKPLFLEYARGLGLDMTRFTADMDGPAVARAMARDEASGADLAVNSTPTFFIGPRRIVGKSQLEKYGVRYVEMELHP